MNSYRHSKDKEPSKKEFKRLNPTSLKIVNEVGNIFVYRSIDYDDSSSIEELLYFLGFSRTDYLNDDEYGNKMKGYGYSDEYIDKKILKSGNE